MTKTDTQNKTQNCFFFFSLREGEEGVQNKQKPVYVICEWSLINRLFKVKSS